VDIETARNAGIPCISVTWGFRDRAELYEHGADHVVDRPGEILELL
jgi:phosphoglycolate phosphatase